MNKTLKSTIEKIAVDVFSLALVFPSACSLNKQSHPPINRIWYEYKTESKHIWYKLNGIWYEDINDSLRYNLNTQYDPKDKKLEPKEVEEFFEKNPIN